MLVKPHLPTQSGAEHGLLIFYRRSAELHWIFHYKHTIVYVRIIARQMKSQLNDCSKHKFTDINFRLT